MPEPLKPMIPKPEEVKQLKTGEAHMAWGCVFFAGGLVALAIILYIFRDFFLEHPIYTVLGLMVVSSLYQAVMYKIKGK
jgi:hypothetical protein